MKQYLLFASSLAASLVMHAYQFQYGNAIYRTLDWNTCSLVKVVDGTSGKVTIPEIAAYTTELSAQSVSPRSTTYEFRVVEVDNTAFNGEAQSNVTEVVLPESITKINGGAFNGCTSLTTVNIPSKVTQLNSVFNHCTSLKKIFIPKTVEKISGVFKRCGTIEEFIIEDSEDPIDISGISETRIKSFYQGRNRGYDNNWFQDQIETAVIGDMVTEIGSGIYSNNPLRSITFGKNIKTIKHQAFANCTELKEVILPESLVELEVMAFHNCAALTTVNFPSQLTEIKSNFNRCPSLEKITIPDNIMNVSSSFQNCGEIEEFVIEDSETPITLSGNFGYTVVKDLYLGRNCGDMAFENRKFENLVMGDKVTELSTGVFSHNSLQTVKFGNNLTKIGSNAFYNCSQLKEVILPESLTELEPLSFSGCSSLSTLMISSQLRKIQQNFYGCTSLKKVVIPSNIEAIESSFNSCGVIEEFIIEDGETLLATNGSWNFINSTVKSIYQGRNCSSNSFENRGVENLVVGDSVKELSNGLYSGNPLKKITLGKNLAIIGNLAFRNCNDIETITSYAEAAPECESSGVFSQAAYDSTKLMVPSGSRKAYNEAPVWKLFKHIGQSTCAVSFDYDNEQCSVALPEEFNGIVKSGETLNFTVAPLESFKITGVNADGEYKVFVQDEEGRWTLDSITGDVNVKIASEIITFAVTAKMNVEAGYLAINGETTDSVRVAWGENAVIALTLNEGYKLDRFTVNDTDVTDRIVDGKLTLKDIREDIAAEAAASLITYSFMTEFDAAHGTVTVGGNAATEQTYTYGSRPEIEILPDEGYCVSWARLNDSDIKPLLANNRYSTDSIKSDMTLSVGFEARTVMLSVLGIEGGRIAGIYDYGAKARVKIIPDECWEINTIVYNGTLVDSSELVDGLFTTPVLTDDSEISVTFENPSGAVDNVDGAAADIRVYGYNRTIHIVNAPEREAVCVYDANGRTVYSGIEREIMMGKGGVYLVTVSNRTFKLML